MPETRDFHLGDILSVATGILVSPRHMDGVYDLLNFLSGQSLYTHQLPRAADECKPSLLRQYPWLDGGEIQFAIGELTLMLDTPDGKAEPNFLVAGWLSKLAATYGEMLPIEADPRGSHPTINPVEELVLMQQGKSVVVVVVGPDEAL